MYSVSTQFITAIKNNARYIKCYFTLNGTEYNPVTITIDNNIYSSDKDAFVGTFIGKSGSIKVRANDNLDLENKDIQLYFGIKLDNDTIEYIPQGTYRVYEKTSNTEYKICDHKIFFNEKINTKEVPYPTTVEKLATWVGKKLNIDVIIPTDFPNRNLTIPSEIFFGYDATYANVVEAIAQATCTFAQINRSGQLEFRWFKKVDFSIDIENLPKGYPVLSKVLDPINSVVLAREPQNDNVYWPESVEDTRSEFKISNNPILDIDRYASRMDIYDRINGFSYTPVSVGTQGFFHLDTGDIVSLQVKDEMYVDMLIMNHTLKYSGGISSQFETPALSKTMIDYSIASSIESHIYRTELEVDKVKNEIRAEIQEINTKVEKIDTTYYHADLTCSGTSITRDNSSITMSVQLLNKSDEVETSDSVFNWKRVSSNAESDTAWDNAHKGRKSITITSSDLEASANFYCDVSAAEWQGSTSAVTVVDETKVPQLGNSFLDVTGVNNVQTLNTDGSYSPSWAQTNPVITPSVIDGVLDVPLSECTTVYKRLISGTEQPLISGETVKDGILTISKNVLSKALTAITYVAHITYKGVTIKLFTSFSLNIIGQDGSDGNDGQDGKGISGTPVITYQGSTSGVVAPTGTWQSSIPNVPEGQFLWTRKITTYTDKSTTTEYSVSKIGQDGTKGDAGKGISGTPTVTYQASDSGTIAPTGTWTSTIPSVSENQYLWTRTITKYTDNTSTTSYSVGKMGADGTDGKGIVSRIVYYAVSASKTTAPTTGWTTATITRPTGQYLWSKEITKFSDGTEAESSPIVISGDKGDTGKGIASYAITYQASTSGTTAPTGTWSNTIPTVQQGQYLWSRTITTYTDNTTSTAYSVSYIPVNGTSVSVKSTSVMYQVSTNGTTAPTGEWKSSIPTVPKGQYLWTRTIVTYTDDKSTTAYSVSYQPTNGSNGTSVTVSSTKTTYQASNSGTTVPTGTWSDTPVAGTAGQYVWTRIIVTYSDGNSTTSYSISRNGNNGATGATGTSTASTVQQYFLSTSKVNPTGGSWTTTPPTWSSGKYLWTRFVITYKNPASTEYTVPVCDSSWEAVNEIEISGRNLLQGTKNFKKGLSTGTLDTEIYKGFSVAYKDNSAGTTYSDVVYYASAIDVEANTYYTLSFYAKGSGSLTSYFYPSNVASGTSSEGKTTTAQDGSISHTLTKDWKRYWITWKTSSTTTGSKHVLPMRLSAGAKGYICGIMFSKGNVAIDWNCALEDINQDIVDAEVRITESYNSAIKLKDEEIRQFVKKSVEEVGDWESALNTLKNEVVLTKDSTEFLKTSSQIIKDLQTGKVDINEIKEWARFTGAILELGASNSEYKVKLSPTELGFYQGNTKVAWISNNELNVTRIVAGESVTIKTFIFVDEGSYGFTLKKVGG